MRKNNKKPSPRSKYKDFDKEAREGNFQDAAMDKEYDKGKAKFGKRRGGNDASWYSSDSALLRDSCSLPFSMAAGTLYDFNLKIPSGTTDDFAPYPTTMGGIMCYKLTPSIGYTLDPSDPVNVAANAFYTYIRHANSGSANYEATDLMMYMIAMANNYSYLNWLMRIYGLATLYAQRNRFLPSGCFKAEGLPENLVIGDLAQFRYGINALINKVSSLAVPADFTIFKRLAFLYQNIYIEGPSIKDSMYMYSPWAFYKYSATGTSANPGSMLKYTLAPQYQGSISSYQDLINYGASLIDVLISDTDINIMSGDILKAYGDSGIVKLASLPMDYSITPIYDETVLQQFKNATILSGSGASIGVSIGDIVQFTGDAQSGPFIYSLPTLRQTTVNAQNTAIFGRIVGKVLDSDRILSTNQVDPGPDVVVESTRLMMSTSTRRLNSAAGIRYFTCGSEVIMSAVIVSGYPANWSTTAFSSIVITEASASWSGSYHLVNDGIMVLSHQANDRIESLLAQFDYKPMLYKYTIDQYDHNTVSGVDTFRVNTVYLHYDYDNFTQISRATLNRINEAAWLNMLHVPSVAKTTNI